MSKRLTENEAKKKVIERCKEIENSITTTFRKSIWLKFVQGIKEFEMIKKLDGYLFHSVKTKHIY